MLGLWQWESFKRLELVHSQRSATRPHSFQHNLQKGALNLEVTVPGKKSHTTHSLRVFIFSKSRNWLLHRSATTQLDDRGEEIGQPNTADMDGPSTMIVVIAARRAATCFAVIVAQLLFICFASELIFFWWLARSNKYIEIDWRSSKRLLGMPRQNQTYSNKVKCVLCLSLRL